MGQIVAPGEFGGASGEDRPGDSMGAGIVGGANFGEGLLEDIAYRNALANVDVAKGIDVNTTRIAQVFEGAGIELIPGMVRHAVGQFFGSAPAIHDSRFAGWYPPDGSVCVDGFRLGDADDSQRNIELIGGCLRILGLLAQGSIPVVEIAADRQVIDQTGERTETLDSIVDGGGPEAVGDYADLEAHRRGGADASQEEGIIKERLATFEVNPADGVYVSGLIEDFLNIRAGNRAALPGTTPDETVITFEGALIGQQEVNAG